MTPLHTSATKAKRYERNLGGKQETGRALTRAKSELMTRFMKEYMDITGTKVMTADLLHSEGYQKALRKYVELWLPYKLAAMKAETK